MTIKLLSQELKQLQYSALHLPEFKHTYNLQEISVLLSEINYNL
jgi:hypothetical protein